MNLSFIFIRALIVAILLFLFFVAGGGISQNDRWRVEQIKVEGTNESDRNKILLFTQEKLKGNYVFMYARENSYLFPRREIERGILEEFSRLKSVKIIKIDNHTLLVSVAEREPFALWCGVEYLRMKLLDDCWFIDDTGFIFERAPLFSTGVYVEVYEALEKTGQDTFLRAALPQERFQFVLAFVRELQKEDFLPLRIFIKPEGEYGVVIDSRGRYPILRDAEIMFKEGQNMNTLIKNFFAALPVQFPQESMNKKKLLYVDLRFGNKVFFGFEKQ